MLAATDKRAELPSKALLVGDGLTVFDLLISARSHPVGVALSERASGPRTRTLLELLGVPAIADVQGLFRWASDGDVALIDADHGLIVINPSKTEVAALRVFEKMASGKKKIGTDRKITGDRDAELVVRIFTKDQRAARVPFFVLELQTVSTREELPVDEGDRSSVTDVNGTVARFEMAYNAGSDGPTQFGPPLRQRIPSFLYLAFAGALAAVVFSAPAAPRGSFIFRFVVEGDNGRPISAAGIALILIASAVGTVIRAHMRGVIVKTRRHRGALSPRARISAHSSLDVGANSQARSG